MNKNFPNMYQSIFLGIIRRVDLAFYHTLIDCACHYIPDRSHIVYA
jgi:hypothetical protein